ncbi:hypothetical protein LXA47_09435 [Massilia sp. P8910]|uniref:hypothetical protein n=1 Tax=Massilia antarctica TaxID=2765360 RepID=UPI001E65BB9C|nr:hypothetical protein [Massilia antarctica]MCE3603828.1 hypothetical protein [Massilia antarctica]
MPRSIHLALAVVGDCVRTAARARKFWRKHDRTARKLRLRCAGFDNMPNVQDTQLQWKRFHEHRYGGKPGWKWLSPARRIPNYKFGDFQHEDEED